MNINAQLVFELNNKIETNVFENTTRDKKKVYLLKGSNIKSESRPLSSFNKIKASQVGNTKYRSIPLYLDSKYSIISEN